MHNKTFAQYTFVSSAGKKAKLHFRNFRLHRKLMMQFRIRAIPFCSKIMLSTNNRQIEADFVKDLQIFNPSRNTCLIEIELTNYIFVLLKFHLQLIFIISLMNWDRKGHILTLQILPHTSYHNHLLPPFLSRYTFLRTNYFFGTFKVTILSFYVHFFLRHFTILCVITQGLITQKKNKFTLWFAAGNLKLASTFYLTHSLHGLL